MTTRVRVEKAETTERTIVVDFEVKDEGVWKITDKIPLRLFEEATDFHLGPKQRIVIYER